MNKDKTIAADIFLAESDYQRSVVNRRTMYPVEDIEAWVVSPEDLILLKLIAGRPRDLADVYDLLFLPGELEVSYMRNWAGELGVSDKLDQALADR